MTFGKRSIKLVIPFIVVILNLFIFTACANDEEESKESVISSTETERENHYFPTLSDNPNVLLTPLTAEDLDHQPDDFLLEFGISSFAFGVDLHGVQRDPAVGFDGSLSVDQSDGMLRTFFRFEGDVKTNFILKTFVNYEATDIKILGEADYTSTFEFSLDGAHEVEIPFTLASDVARDALRLTTIIIFDPIHNLIEDDSMVFHDGDSYGMALNFDLVTEEASSLFFDNLPEPTIVDRIENEFFPRFAIHQRFEGFENNFWWRRATDFITDDDWRLIVDRGEPIRLAFHASPQPYNKLEDYIIIGLLDWQQIPLNGQPFLYVDVENGDQFNFTAEHGIIELEPINEPGTYIFSAILVTNPLTRLSESLSHIGELSTRFIIEVQ